MVVRGDRWLVMCWAACGVGVKREAGSCSVLDRSVVMGVSGAGLVRV